ncbi:hypothetical protein QN277_012139 [Acacia crassicarpa]|uniref:Uncharacterized protein n=1 Tax=Acacia crassicarpa TaxID=499986 RepID=A0AAE1TDF0_9FABA|nr:hypothetical protein QN277_012139 [Acacia crassicarpa]
MDPPLCACGFFGSHENNNMCSKCYKDHVLKLNEQIYQSMANLTISSPSDDQDLHTADEHKNDESSLISKVSESDEPREKKKRCKSCNKKVGLTGFKCQCGELFCGKHRYPEEHSCTVDYKQIGRELLRKQNPLIQSDKL